MNKKTIKAILDVIKDVKDRPGLYGAKFYSTNHVIDTPVLLFSNGYVMVKLDCGLYNGLHSINEDMWVSGEQLETLYKGMGAKDVALNLVADDASKTPNFKKVWDGAVNKENTDVPVGIDPEVFKKIAPFGKALMSIKENRIVLFNGQGWSALACPLKED